MIIAGLAVGATKGYIYLRSEYPRAREILTVAIANARAEAVPGGQYSRQRQILRCWNCGWALERISAVRRPSLLDSLEGKRGMVRAKPPVPAIAGLFGQPTVVNNVLTLAAVTTVLEKGSEFYRDFGVGRSRGTLAVQLAGNIRRGGLVELAYGATLRQLVDEFGGGTYSGRPMRAIQVGGPLGAYLPESQWDTPLDYEAFAGIRAMLGHGGVVVFDDTVDMAAQARFALEFCAVESCGKCTPCRIWARCAGWKSWTISSRASLLRRISRCCRICATPWKRLPCAHWAALTPQPVRSALAWFPEDFS